MCLWLEIVCLHVCDQFHRFINQVVNGELHPHPMAISRIQTHTYFMLFLYLSPLSFRPLLTSTNTDTQAQKGGDGMLALCDQNSFWDGASSGSDVIACPCGVSVSPFRLFHVPVRCLWSPVSHYPSVCLSLFVFVSVCPSAVVCVGLYSGRSCLPLLLLLLFLLLFLLSPSLLSLWYLQIAAGQSNPSAFLVLMKQQGWAI